MRLPLLLLTAALAACSGASPDRGIAAEGGGLGFAERGSLARGDAQSAERYVDAYRVDVEREHPLAVGVASGAMDTVLELVSPSGTARLVADCTLPDGTPGSNDACVTIPRPEPGTWLVRVTTQTGERSGGYTFVVEAPAPGPVRAVPAADVGPMEAAPPRAPAVPVRPAVTDRPPPARPSPADPPAGNPTVDQSISGSFTGADAEVRLDGRQHPAVRTELVLLEGDDVTVRFESEAFEPLLVLERDGQTVATARAEADPVGGQLARIRYTVTETGGYVLFFGTASPALRGAFEAEVSFVRTPDRIRQAPRVEDPVRPDGRAYSQREAIEAYLSAAPGLASLRGQRLRQEVGATVYAPTLPFPQSAETTLSCQGDRCQLTALLPTLDARAAIETASLFVQRFEAASDYRFDSNLPDVTDPSDPNVSTYRFTSPDLVVTVSYDVGRYDAVLGVPVVVTFADR